MPPHTTHLIQPLDVVVFQPLKHYHAEAIDKATRTGCSDFNKLEFLSAITSIREQAFKESTIISSFRRTSLIPYNPDIVLSRLPESVYVPSYDPPVTPPSIYTENFSTPKTIRSLARHALFLQSCDPISPTFQTTLQQYIKRSLAQAHAGAQAYKDLENTHAAENACAIRQNRSRRSVQKGGVIYAHQARAMVHKRAADAAKKTVEQAERELERVRKAAIQDRKRKWKSVLQELKRFVKRQNSSRSVRQDRG